MLFNRKLATQSVELIRLVSVREFLRQLMLHALFFSEFCLKDSKRKTTTSLGMPRARLVGIQYNTWTFWEG